jgi:hypothetical protein
VALEALVGLGELLDQLVMLEIKVAQAMQELRAMQEILVEMDLPELAEMLVVVASAVA